MINPYCNPSKLDLELLSFEEPDLKYEFNTLCFWKAADRTFYTAQDAGCSCPEPFEKYKGKDQEQVLRKLERLGLQEQAEQTLKSWLSGCSTKLSLTDCLTELHAFYKA